MKRLFAILAFAGTLFTACEPATNTPEDNPQDESNFIVTTKTVELTAEGGEGVIEYTLSQPSEGLGIEVTNEAEWISDITVDETITFAVAANEATEERTATINVRYGAENYDVAVKQAGAQNEEPEPTPEPEPEPEPEPTPEPELTPEGYPEDSNPDNYSFKHRMLLIDHTGTDCGYCPYMMQALKVVEEDPAYNDFFNIAMAHSYNQDDKAYSRAALIIRGYYQVTLKILTGFPTLTFNYQHKEKSGQYPDVIKDLISKLHKDTQDAAVAVAAELDGDKMVVKAALKSKEARNYKINILLLEDGIYCKQYGANEEWMNTHNNAIRDSYYDLPTDYSDISGVEWGDVAAMTTEYKTFEMPINTKYVKENCKVLVVIAAPDSQYGNKYEVVNTTMCKPGEIKPFEYR